MPRQCGWHSHCPLGHIWQATPFKTSPALMITHHQMPHPRPLQRLRLVALNMLSSPDC